MSKRNLKQALTLLAAITMMSCAAACGAGTEAVGSASGEVPQITAEVAAESESAEISKEAETATEMKTIEPPEDGWTKEQLNEVMYLCDEPFSLPCKLEDFEKYFTLGDLSEHTKEDTEWVPDELEMVYKCPLYVNHNGEDVCIGAVIYHEDKSKSNIVYATEFVGWDIFENSSMISINGLNCFSKPATITTSLGDNYTFETRKIYDDDYNTYVYNIKSDYNEEKLKVLTCNDNILAIDYELY